MASYDWNTIEPILDEVLDAAPGDRSALLEARCAGDQALREEISRLVAASEETNGFLDSPVEDRFAQLISDIHDSGDPVTVGPYKLVREIARGGMGAVFLAERADGQFQQTVALKLIKRGMDSDEIVRRFYAERQILARLTHPNIARLLDGGVTATGQPWFAMEHVDGEAITHHCRDHNLDIDARLELFEHVCDAVKYAHQNLIVHRDLKPSNILVTSSGIVKLLDFGIAKLLDDSSDAGRTATGLARMTPEYAAPEQIRLEPATTATDVYSLGAVLYELLSGKRAHAFTKRTHTEIERVICDVDPSPPRLGTELDTIVLKALQKDPVRRYASADALAEDIHRFRARLPLRARPDTAAYRARKFIRRHRLGVAAAIGIVVSLAGGLAVAAMQARTARREAARANVVREFLVDVFQGANATAGRGRDITALELVDRGVQRLDTALAQEPEIQGELLDVLGRVYYSLGNYSQSAKLHERAVALSERLYGRNDRRVVAPLTALAATVQVASDYARSDTLLMRALSIWKRSGGDDREVVETIEHLANLKRLRSRHAEAESLYHRAIALRRQENPQKILNVAQNYRLLSLVHWETAKYDAADSAISQALALQRPLVDSAHPDFLRSLRNLALIRVEQGRVREARRISRYVLDQRMRLYPRGNPEVATSMEEHAKLLEAAGEFTEAESLYTRSYSMRRDLLGPEKIETLNSLMGIGVVKWRKGDYPGAVTAARQVVTAFQKSLGPDHRLTLAAKNHIGYMLRDAGSYAESEKYLREAIAGRTEASGKDHVTVAASLRHLGVLLRRVGRYTEAETTSREALRVYRAALPARHINIALPLNDLGALFIETGRFADAEPFLLEALSIREEKMSADDPAMIETRTMLNLVGQKTPGGRKP